MEQHNLPQEFEIQPAREADVAGIGEAQLESWLETYPNSELGIDEQWIGEQVGFLVEKRGNDFRLNTVREAMKPNSDQLYLVVKNHQGKIRGFLHITKHGDSASFDAIYLTKEVQGTGIAHDLMNRALDFAGHLPMAVEVADYNQRAIHFYEKYGFAKDLAKANKHLHRDKIPIMVMIREAHQGEKK